MLRPQVRSFAIVPLVSGFALLLSSVGPPAAATPKSATHTIVIDSLRFDPQDLTVKAGDTIIWTNRDPFPHTATAEGKQFDSHAIEPGRSWTVTAKKAAVISYGCTYHATMKGTLRVE